MITADKARELAGPTVEQHLSLIEQWIVEAATAKKHCLMIRQEPYASWLYGDSRPAEADKVINTLRSLRKVCCA